MPTKAKATKAVPKTRKQKIAEMERVVKKYSPPQRPASPAKREKSLLDKASAKATAMATEALGTIRNRGRQIKSGIETRQKLQARRGARYVKTMRELKKK